MHAKALLLLALGAPLAASAQVTYYSNDFPLTREELRACMDRDASLRARQADVDSEKLDNDRERDAIDREGAILADELRHLDSMSPGAVASYNARTADHNARVQVHNRRIAEGNARAALVNGDQADMNSSCGSRRFSLHDRDAIVYGRGTLR